MSYRPSMAGKHFLRVVPSWQDRHGEINIEDYKSLANYSAANQGQPITAQDLVHLNLLLYYCYIHTCIRGKYN